MTNVIVEGPTPDALEALRQRDPSTYSVAERIMADDLWPEFIESCSPTELETETPYAWDSFYARPEQQLPDGKWSTWMIRAGRGFGKTRTGSEAVRKRVDQGKAGHVTIGGPTAADARDIMVEGPSGILAVHPEHCRPIYEPSKRLITWPNGAVGHVRSAEDPDSFRGLNSDLIWFDEPAAMRYGKESWDNAQLGNRLGDPRSILTGTPRPLEWLRKLEARPSTRLTVGSTFVNAMNLAETFLELVLDMYEGTRLGAQELHARYLEDVEGALWALSTIEAGRIALFERSDPWRSLVRALAPVAEAFGRTVDLSLLKERRRWKTVVGVDPPGETAECGIVAVTAPESGRGARDHAVVLDDASLAGPPELWAPQVVATYRKYEADCCVVESNMGDAYRAVIHNVDPTVRVEKVHAKESKQDRAEPVSMLYAKGWVHHLGTFAKLEDQMTTWVPLESKSPDRIDALVHAVNFLLKPAALSTATIADAQRRAAETRLT